MNSEALMDYYRGLFQNPIKRNKKLKSAKKKLREKRRIAEMVPKFLSTKRRD